MSVYREPGGHTATLRDDVVRAIDSAEDAVRQAMHNANRLPDVALRRSMQDHLATAMLQIRRIQDPFFDHFDALESRVTRIEEKLGLTPPIALVPPGQQP